MTASIEQPQNLAGRIPTDIVEVLPGLVRYWVGRCMPLDNKTMTDQLTALLRLVAGFLGDEERTETMGVLSLQLRKVPADLAVDAIDYARDNCRRVNDLLPTITAYLEDYPDRRRRQRDQYIALAKVAGVLPTERTDA